MNNPYLQLLFNPSREELEKQWAEQRALAFEAIKSSLAPLPMPGQGTSALRIGQRREPSYSLLSQARSRPSNGPSVFAAANRPAPGQNPFARQFQQLHSARPPRPPQPMMAAAAQPVAQATPAQAGNPNFRVRAILRSCARCRRNGQFRITTRSTKKTNLEKVRGPSARREMAGELMRGRTSRRLGGRKLLQPVPVLRVLHTTQRATDIRS
jgi:hypothetical protein